MNTKGFRQFQLKTMGFIAVFIGPIVLASTTLIHTLPFPSSISETATIANRTSPILPFCLGALALFALSYAITYAYDRLDRVLTFCIFAGFTIVALQMSASPYIEVNNVGILGVSEAMSGILHNTGALVGFGAMSLWIMVCFTKSDKPRNAQTKEKRTRNNVYFFLGLAMMLLLGVVILNFIGVIGDERPVVFVAEWVMLTFGGIACWIKGGLFLKDKVT